jgi:hypothetical protein
MATKILAILFLTICFGCNKKLETPYSNAKAESLQIYFDRFADNAKRIKGDDLYGSVMPMILADLHFDPNVGGIVGTCNSYSDGRREVVIDQGFWATASDDVREELVYHELGHCLLNRAHNNLLDTQGQPGSIMNPYLLRESSYRTHRETFVQELFNFSPLFNPSGFKMADASANAQEIYVDSNGASFCDEHN